MNIVIVVQVVTESTPVYRTETVYETDTINLRLVREHLKKVTFLANASVLKQKNMQKYFVKFVYP